MKQPLPIRQMLEQYARRGADRWHMPGHKGCIEPMPGSWDVTEVEGCDNLHQPREGIARAQQLLAEAVGAAHSHLLVGGSTAGIHAMLAMLAPGEGVILSRWVHKAAVNALQLYSLTPHWVQPRWDGAAQLPADSPEAILRAIEDHGEAAAVFVTSPDYYGRCLPLEEIARAAHSRGMLLLVDSAHGAHLPFSPLLPPSPAGLADLWVASAHKTLPGLTQSAWLHGAASVRPERLLRRLAWVQSSSPSYWLMASLDGARAMAQEADWPGLIDRCRRLEEGIRCREGLTLLERQDPTRLVVDVSGRGLTGLEAMDRLRERGIEPEMADLRRVVFIATPWDGQEKFGRLLTALGELEGAGSLRSLPPLPEPGERVLPLSCARGETGSVPLRQAQGRIAADAGGAYPPGIALWQPGERITGEQIAYLEAITAAGGELFGVYEDRVEVVT